jgi:hypothetical protein
VICPKGHSRSSFERYLLLVGKQDAGFVRKTLKFCDDLTFDEYGQTRVAEIGRKLVSWPLLKGVKCSPSL